MKNKMLKIGLFVLGIIIISIILLVVIFKYIKNYSVSNQLVFSQEYNSLFNEIDIDSQASDIQIKKGTDSNIKVLIYGDKERTNVDATDSKLSITTTQKKCDFLCMNFKISKIEVYVPVDYSKSISIDNKFGDIIVEDFSQLNLNIEANAGDVIIGDANSIEAKLDFGDIKINKVNEYLNIKNACGDIKIDTLNLEKDSNIHSNLGNIKIGTTNKIYFDAKTSLGDVKINNNYRDANVVLKITNDCGDIKVNN